MHDNPFNTPWRRTAAAIYKAPADAKIWGTYEADVSKTLDFITRKKKLGLDLTLTHLVVAAVARAYHRDVPELNCHVKRGRIIRREHVGVFVSVEMPETREMTGFVIDHAEEKSLRDIHDFMRARVEKYRKRHESGAVENKNMLAGIPWPLRRPVFLFLKFITVTLGLAIPALKLDPGSFGSVLVSNIGSHGLQYGMAAILPVSNLPVVVLMGRVEKKPVVRNNRIVVRDILPFSSTLDHRVCDGAMGGRLAQAVQRYLEKPEILESL